MCFATRSMHQFLDLALYAEAVCPKLVGAVVKHMPGGAYASDGWQNYLMISDVRAEDGGLVSGTLNWAL